MPAVTMSAITIISSRSDKIENTATTTTASADISTDVTTTAAVETTKDPNEDDGSISGVYS